MMDTRPPSTWEQLEALEAAERDRARRLRSELMAAGESQHAARRRAFFLVMTNRPQSAKAPSGREQDAL